MGHLSWGGCAVILLISLVLAGVPVALFVRLVRNKEKSVLWRALGGTLLALLTLPGLVGVYIAIMFTPPF